MRCVILGGAGFLGRHVGFALAEAGHQVWSVDRVPAGSAGAVPWVSGEICANYADVDSWWDQCSGAQVLVHLASSTIPASASADPVADVEANLTATLRLLRGLRERGVRPRLLFASSGGAVYGTPRTVPLDEAHPTAPLSAYGVTKLAIEHYLHIAEAQQGLPYRILRLSNPYGPGQNPQGAQGVIAVFAYRALHGQPVTLWGDGSVVRDFIHAQDVGRAFVAAASHAGPSRVFNIGAGAGLSVNQVLGTLEHVLQRGVEREVHPARPFDPPVNVLDTSLARRELQWQPRIAFDEGLTATLEWLRTLP